MLDPGRRAPARSLGASWFFLPAAAAGRVWLALLDPRSPDTVRALRGVREVTVDGRVIVGRSARPPRPPLVALATGLVLQAERLELWDPVTGRIVRRLPGVFPVAGRGSLLVSCSPGCPALFVTDTRGAAGTREIKPGAAFHFVESYGGAFSPDGSAIAVAAATPDGQSRVAVVDLRDGVARLVAGVRWASTSRWRGRRADGSTSPPTAGGWPRTGWARPAPGCCPSTSGRSPDWSRGDRAAGLLERCVIWDVWDVCVGVGGGGPWS